MVVGDQGDERDGGAQQPGRHTGKTVESLFGGSFQEGGAAERGQPVGAGQQTVWS